MKFENVALLIPLGITVGVLFFLSDVYVFESEKGRKPTEAVAKQGEMSAEAQANAEDPEYAAALEKTFDEYDKIYEEEYTEYKTAIEDQWGEFKESSSTQWVSYVDNNDVRRTVDYETGEIVVEMLLEKTKAFNTQRKQALESKVYNLLSSTESGAFYDDELAQRIEDRLPSTSQIIERGSPSDKRLFTIDKVSSISFNYSGYVKVSTRFRNTATVGVQPAKIKGFNVIRSYYSVDPSTLQNAVRYEESVGMASREHKIPTAVIFGIMESESSFNPVARSRVPAYGLMQIVPRSAGKDATKHLYGKAKVLAPSYLYSSDNNIEIGAAYLHVIYYKYMSEIKDHNSRIYCAIAAYNTGSTNVARAFIETKNFSRAVEKINAMTSDEVYVALTQHLRFREARKYVKKVAGNMKKYW